jgi:hypothetical protein
MQVFSADATIFKKKIELFFAPENIKKKTSKVAHNWPPIFFQYCQPAQNQLKSHFLFHKNVSLRDFYIMTLATAIAERQESQENNFCKEL